MFETAATTNTRCRQCRHVVNIGRSPRNRPSGRPCNERPRRRTGTSETYESNDDEEEPTGEGWVLAAFLVACVVAIWLGDRGG